MRLPKAGLAVLLVGVLTAGARGEVLKFDFERTGRSTTFEGFKSVTPITDYTPERGYGWVGASGPSKQDWLENRIWKAGDRGVNGCVRANSMIDALAQDYCTSSVPFVVDLPNGKYHVWVMVGDWGAYEWYPHGAYTVLAQDKEIGKWDTSTREKFMPEFLRHKYTDYEPKQQLFEVYATPRFPEYQADAEVTEGKLKIEVRCDVGPEEYCGPINGVVIYPEAEKDQGEKFLKDLHAARKAVFDKNFSYPELKETYSEGVTDQEKERGFLLFPVPPDGEVFPNTYRRTKQGLESLEAFATRDEYEPLRFCIIPCNSQKPLTKVTVTVSELVGEKGDRIAQTDLQVGYVKYLHEYQRNTRLVRPVSGLLMDRSWFVPYYKVTKQAWITVHVPANALGGDYKGTVRVQAEGGGSADIPVTFTVIPVKLDEPRHALGFNYSAPDYVTWFPDGQRLQWEEVTRDFRVMRTRGMTTVATGFGPLPIDNNDTAQFEQLLDLYQKTGFPAIFYHAGVMNLSKNSALIQKYGTQWNKAWQDAFCGILRKLNDAAKKHNQPVTFSITDETTNEGYERLAWWVAKTTRQELPEINLAGDINGYRELMLTSPYLNVAGFNNGWGGSYGLNRARRLIRPEVIARVKANGCTPWFVNGGKGRYPFGLFFWKSTKWGMDGKIEWHYCADNSDYYNPFDSQEKNSFSSDVYPGQITSVVFEESREGIDDLRYIETLERLVAELAKQGDKLDPIAAGNVAKAKEALDFYVEEAADTVVTSAPDGSGQYVGSAWPKNRLDAMRKEVASYVVLLSGIASPRFVADPYVLEDWETQRSEYNTTNSWGAGDGCKASVSAEHPTEGKKCLKLEFTGGKGYSDNWGRLRTTDWRGFRTFTMDVFNPQPRPVKFTVNLRDQLAANLQDYNLRHMETLTLAPGKNTLKFDLLNMKSLDGKHQYDMDCMFNIFFSLADETQDTTLYLDNLLLHR